MINKNFDQIEKADIEALVAHAVGESRMLDYKESLPGGVDADKREFLADVSSFANASGGDLIFGIREQRDAANKPTSVPEAVCGLPGVNVDAEKLRLENILRDGLDPRAPGIQIRAINGFEGGPVMLFRIPKSWASPHMVKFSSRFYSRNNAGKYPLDVREIRAAFFLSQDLPERIRRFRDDRLAKIVANETPLPLREKPKVVLQVLPITSFEPAAVVDVKTIRDPLVRLKPIPDCGCDGRFNFDGFITFFQHRESPCAVAYTQLFRNGAIEAVDTFLLEPGFDDKKQIPSVDFERYLISIIQHYLETERQLELHPPIFVVLTLLGVHGYRMAVAPGRESRIRHPIDRDSLLLPEVIIEDFGVKVATVLRPVFDALWQAAGHRGSPNYDENDNWKAHA
ncbi:MAG: ATP-binding protein [Verrucomicrobia bacterium]|nr:ATP-binding protein [Verrucomicrobiota bacterium]